MYGAGYQLVPRVNAFASRLAPAAAKPAANAEESTSRSLYRATICSAPPCLFGGSKLFFGRVTPIDAASPVRKIDPATSHASLATSVVMPPLVTGCDDRTYSPNAP